VDIDIKPGSCPNPIKVKSKGKLPAVAPLRSSLEDVATPFDSLMAQGDCYDCNEEGPDGFMDLIMKFKTQEIVEAIGDVEDGDCLVLELTGNLKEEFGGTEINSIHSDPKSLAAFGPGDAQRSQRKNLTMTY